MCLSPAVRPQVEFSKHWVRATCTHLPVGVPSPVLQLPHTATHHSAGSIEWAVGRAYAMFGFGIPLPSMHGPPMSTESMMCTFVEQMADKGAFLGGSPSSQSHAAPKLSYLDDQLAAIQNFMLIADFDDFFYWRPDFYKKIEEDGKTDEIVGVTLRQQLKKQAMAVAPLKFLSRRI